MSNEAYDDIFDAVDPSTVGDLAQGYPVVQWVNGDPKADPDSIQGSGGWFISEDRMTEPLPDPFRPQAYRNRRGEAIPGFAARDLTVAIIRWRRRWLYADDDREHWFPYRAYDRAKAEADRHGRALRAQAHILVAIRGLETFGPFVLTVKGSTSRAFFSGRGGILATAQKTLQKPALDLGRRQRGREFPGLPLHAFWTTVGPERHPNGNPKYSEVGSSHTATVTLPTALGLPANPVRDLSGLVPHVVDKEGRLQFDEWFHQAESWAQTWDASDEKPGAAVAVSETTPKSAMEVYEEPDQDDDIPF